MRVRWTELDTRFTERFRRGYPALWRLKVYLVGAMVFQLWFTGCGGNGKNAGTAPTIASLMPTSGPVGTAVTITGTNFSPAAGATTVTFNGTAVTATVASSTTISTTVPTGATTGNIVVTVSGQASNGVNFTVTGSGTGPTISSLSPTSGAVGTQVTITGMNFGSSGTVTFNGTTAMTSSWNSTTIVTTVPTGATTGNVVVTVGGVASNGVNFTVTGSGTGPTISSLSPTSGAVGTQVTITGTNFGSSGTVTFNGTTATTSSWNSTTIVTTVPTGATTGNVVVTVGGVASNGVNFTVTGSGTGPTISSLSPTSGAVGTQVTITGTNFGSSGTVTFNGTTATTSSWNSTTIVTTVPSGATTGNVVVTVGGVASNGVNFTVTGSGTGPTISSLSPTSGAVGTQVTITGTNFGSSGTVTFNGTTATTSSWNSTTIVTTVPSGATTGNVVVTVGGVASNGVNFTVTSSAGVPPTFIQHSTCGGTANGCTTPPANYTGANFYVVGVSEFGTNKGTVSDSSGDIFYGPYLSPGGSAIGALIYYAPNVSATGQSAEAFTYSSGGAYPTVAVEGFSNVSPSSPLAQYQQNEISTAATSITAGASAISPASDNQLLFTVVENNASTVAQTINDSFTITDQRPAGSSTEGGGGAYLIQSAASSVNPTWSWTTNSAAAAAIESFLPSTGNAYTEALDFSGGTNGSTLTPATLAASTHAGGSVNGLAGGWGGTFTYLTYNSACGQSWLTNKNVAGNSYLSSAGSLGVEMNTNTGTNSLITYFIPAPSTHPLTASQGYWFWTNIPTSDTDAYLTSSFAQGYAGDDWVGFMLSSGKFYISTGLRVNSTTPDVGSAFSYTPSTWYWITDQYVNTAANGTYSSSLTIGKGTLSITIGTGLNYTAGQPFIIYDTGAPANYMSGSVTSYNSSTGAFVGNVVNTGGSGSFSTWTLSNSYHTLEIYSASGTLLSTQKNVANPADTTPGFYYYSIGRDTYGSGHSASGTYVCYAGMVFQWEGAPEFPILP